MKRNNPEPKAPLMVPSWAPVSRQILESSVWNEEPYVRVAWLGMILIGAEPGRNGTVDMTAKSLAARLNLSIEQTQDAIVRLCAPDPHSRSKEHEGRRLALIDPERNWGWVILNFEKYRVENLREANARRVRLYRERQKRLAEEEERSARVMHSNAHVMPGNACNECNAGEERMGKDKTGKGEENEHGTPPPLFETPRQEAAWKYWLQYLAEKGFELLPTVRAEHIDFFRRLGQDGMVASIKASIRGGYTRPLPPRPEEIDSSPPHYRVDPVTGRDVQVFDDFPEVSGA